MATDEQNEKRRAYIDANREKINAQRRARRKRKKQSDPEYYQKYLEKGREYTRRRYQERMAQGLGPVKTPAERRAYYAANRDRINETRHRWYIRPEVRDKINARIRADRAANPEKYREQERRKRARRREKREQSQVDG
ncbi:MAG: hypothetical protein A2Z18_05445 [Armatimonadetes bacterium RBG_16_58_9]|nr:MAG: hypothetical protein A2Z18_05445 [Armatimonadetes bacterium RBG_16_58_9]